MRMMNRTKDTAPNGRSRSGHAVLCIALALALAVTASALFGTQQGHTETIEKETYIGAGTPVVLDGGTASGMDYDYNGSILRFMSGADGNEYEISQTLPAGSSQDIRIEYGIVTVTVSDINITGNIEVWPEQL